MTMTITKPTIVALLTARGGSSLPHKNLRKVYGSPILDYGLTAAKAVSGISHFYASSDDEGILSAAEWHGYKPIHRPARISGSQARHIDAVVHAIEEIRMDGVDPDLLVVLMGNSVCITAEMIYDCLKLALSNMTASAVIPVVQDNDHHPWRAKTLDGRGMLSSFVNFSGLDVSTNRQDLSPCYWIAQNFWVIRLPLRPLEGEAPWTFLGPEVVPYIIPYACPDVHDETDLILSERWLDEHA